MTEQLAGDATSSSPASTTAGWRARRLVGDPAALMAIFVLLIVVVAAILADLIAPYDPAKQALDIRRTGPTADHLLGTDQLGRDILSRLLFGARATVFASTLAVAISVAVGVPLGLVSGFYGRFIGGAIMRAMDVMLAFPSFLLAIVLVAILGPTLQNAAIAIGVAGIPTFARVVRGSVLAVRGREFVLGATASGAGDMRLMIKYILPNVSGPILVLGTLSFGTAVLSVAGLSFLGLGAQPPAAEWGIMVGDGRPLLREAPHIAAFPGIAIMLFVLAVNVLGDAVQYQLDPRSERRSGRIGPTIRGRFTRSRSADPIPGR